MKTGIYVHIPYCLKRCNYCDFYTFGGNNSVPQEYINQIINEIARYDITSCPTVYFGGGTPSLMTANQINQILSVLPIEENAEITLEANPETLTYQKLQDFYSTGINRLSIGVQTVYDKSLENLGRVHHTDKVIEVFKNAKQVGFKNISADIMIGLGDYSYQELDDTIDTFYNNSIQHISCYMLKVEEGTPFGNNPPKNLPTEDEMSDYYLYACNKLKSLGYDQYEISNFAKQGYESRHNSIYWKLENYLGIGPSAHSCINGQRFYYPRDLNAFLNQPKTQLDDIVTKDDYIMLSLRLREGLNFDTLKEKYNITYNDIILNQLQRLEDEGFVIRKDNSVSLTPKGFLVENAIVTLLM